MIPFNKNACKEDRMIRFNKNEANNSIIVSEFFYPNTSKTIEPKVSEKIEQIANNKLEQIASKTVNVSETIETNARKN